MLLALRTREHVGVDHLGVQLAQALAEISMLWSNSWFPRHACVTGMAFIALTAAAPRSNEDRSEGDRKSPFNVHRYASPGWTLSWMKHFKAERFWSSYTVFHFFEKG